MPGAQCRILSGAVASVSGVWGWPTYSAAGKLRLSRSPFARQFGSRLVGSGHA